MVGESNRSISYPRAAPQAFQDVQSAFAAAGGKVLESQPGVRSVTGRLRFGLQSIKLRVSVIPQGDSESVLQVQAFGDDIWGGGARKATDKLVRALDRVST